MNIQRILPVLAVALLLTGCTEQTPVLRQQQHGSHSSGSRWECELSNDTVLEQRDYYETSFLGPGFTQHWEFAAIGEGDVTICWKSYNSGRDFDAQKSYYAVYHITEHEIIFIGQRPYIHAETDVEYT